MGDVLPFDPRPRDIVVIDLGTITKSDVPAEIGAVLFFVRLMTRAGDDIVVWDGRSRMGALAAAAEWLEPGTHLVDRTGVLDA